MWKHADMPLYVLQQGEIPTRQLRSMGEYLPTCRSIVVLTRSYEKDMANVNKCV